MSEEDIFLWPGGFWCYRKEFEKAPNRDKNYRVIPQWDLEWFRYARPDPNDEPGNGASDLGK